MSKLLKRLVNNYLTVSINEHIILEKELSKSTVQYKTKISFNQHTNGYFLIDFKLDVIRKINDESLNDQTIKILHELFNDENMESDVTFENNVPNLIIGKIGDPYIDYTGTLFKTDYGTDSIVHEYSFIDKLFELYYGGDSMVHEYTFIDKYVEENEEINNNKPIKILLLNDSKKEKTLLITDNINKYYERR